MQRQGWRALAFLFLIAALPSANTRAQQPAPASDASASQAAVVGTDQQASLVSARLSDVREQPVAGASDAADPNSMSAILARLKRVQDEIAAARADLDAPADAPPPGQSRLHAVLTALQSGPIQRNVEDRIASVEGILRHVNPFPLVRLSGFLNYDTDFYSQDAASHAQLGNVQNGTGFRRARLQALGKVSEFTNFSLEMEFAGNGRPSFFDVWGEQMNLPLGTVRVGQFRQPITMDAWTSVRHLEFMERSAPFQAFDPFRRVGIMNWWNSENGRTLVAFSIYGAGSSFWNSTQNGSTNNTQTQILGTDNRFGTTLGNGAALALRATHLIWYDDPSDGRYLMHVGTGYNASQIGGNADETGGGTYRAASIPETFTGDPAGSFSTLAGTPQVLDTGRFKAHGYQLLHAEWAANYGSFHFQTEWLGTAVAQDGGPTVYYDGAYAQCGYFLTGESAGYAKNMGAMDYNVKPFSEFFGLGSRKGICGWGAWEVAGRWSYLDLQTSRIRGANYVGTTGTPGTPGFVPGGAAGPSTANPNPGVLNESTVGLNWYWNQFSRVQINWVHTMLSSQYVVPGRDHFSVMDAACIRYQIEF
ncbi:MAG TPA: porin [Pirellulales bacterium]|jgi:phosphate-selective porin OprO/OprP|nr:porin [Pirellulales bacterium]